MSIRWQKWQVREAALSISLPKETRRWKAAVVQAESTSFPLQNVQVEVTGNPVSVQRWQVQATLDGCLNI